MCLCPADSPSRSALAPLRPTASAGPRWGRAPAAPHCSRRAPPARPRRGGKRGRGGTRRRSGVLPAPGRGALQRGTQPSAEPSAAAGEVESRGERSPAGRAAALRPVALVSEGSRAAAVSWFRSLPFPPPRDPSLPHLPVCFSCGFQADKTEFSGSPSPCVLRPGLGFRHGVPSRGPMFWSESSSTWGKVRVRACT